jgi:hypothetical protein
MAKFLIPALAVLPLLGGVPPATAIAATADALGIPASQAPIVQIEESCGNGYFRDGYGYCRAWYGGEPAHRPHEGCPPDRHFEHWANHEGGFCAVNR